MAFFRTRTCIRTRPPVRALALGLGLLALGAGAAPAQAQDGAGHLAVVATERLYAESKLAKAADARIEAQFSSRDKDNRATLERLKKLSDQFDADAPSLAAPERTRRARALMERDKDMQRLDQAYRDDLQERKNYERARIAERAYALIVELAEQQNIDVVFRDALWSRPGIDITDHILRQLDR